jgi:hypothetical protein
VNDSILNIFGGKKLFGKDQPENKIFVAYKRPAMYMEKCK